MSTNNTAAPAAVQITDAPEVERSAKELRRENKILDMARKAGLNTDQTDELITSGKPIEDCAVAVFEHLRSQLSPSRAGHPVTNTHVINMGNDERSPLERAFDARLAGERTAPLWLIARDQYGVPGESAAQVFGTILKRGGKAAWVSRGMMATADLPELLLGSGDRRLQAIFESEGSGIYEAAGIQSFSDFRAKAVIDVGLVGKAQTVIEGGELTYTSLSENAGSYTPKRKALGLSMSYEALVNDNLDGLVRGIDELAAEMLDAESRDLVDLLEAGADGADTPDGLAIFDAAHLNSVTAAAVTIGHLGAGVRLLRQMTTLSGRFIANEPRVLICRPADELAFRQITAADYQPAAGTGNDGANPWKNIAIAVEPRLTEAAAFLLGSNSRRPLELGRLTPSPELEQERDFDTRALKARAEHAYGVIAAEHRSIVRLLIT